MFNLKEAMGRYFKFKIRDIANYIFINNIPLYKQYKNNIPIKTSIPLNNIPGS